jgi:16S rRNA (uracil1498-N3)-methyltransferase
MQVFFATDIKGNTCVLDKNESRHAVRVLRMTRGDEIKLVDGIGNLYEGIISDPDPAGCVINITGVTGNFEKRSYRLHVAISPLKNNERFEWFVEKSVEIGVDEITPVICSTTERQGIKLERVNNIIISAMKQSLKAYRPVLNDPLPFEDFINSDHDGLKMIAHCNPVYDRIKINEIYDKNSNAVVMIGPEGDFSEEELKMAFEAGFKAINLGTSRLRAETAGIAACHSVYFINH